MGVRGEVFSARASSGNRTYFFNVKENRAGDLFLNIVESKKHGEEGFERHQIVVFEEELSEFLVEFEKAANFMKRNMRGREGRGREGRGREGRGREGRGREGRGRGERGRGNDRESLPRRDSDYDGYRDREFRGNQESTGNNPPRVDRDSAPNKGKSAKIRVRRKPDASKDSPE